MTSFICEVELTLQFYKLMAMKYTFFQYFVFVTLFWNLVSSNNVEITNVKVSTKNPDKIEILLNEFDKTSTNNVFNLKEEFNDVKVCISVIFKFISDNL